MVTQKAQKGFYKVQIRPYIPLVKEEPEQVFLDKKGLSPPISVKGFLVDSDTVPLIIGFEDVLTDIKLVCDYRTKTAFLQIPI